MSYSGGNYSSAGTTNRAVPTCQSCHYSYTICQCGINYGDFAHQRAYAGAYIAPLHPTFSPAQYLPLQQVGDRFPMSSSQGAGASTHYNMSEQLCQHHGGRVMSSGLMNTFASGGYAYGRNSEQKTRSEERLAALLDPVIMSLSEAPLPARPDPHDDDDLRLDPTVDPSKLSLPLVEEKVPCPQCGRLLKDDKSVSRHIARQHNPVEYFDCQEYNCNYSTQKKADLVRHTRSKHSNDLDPKPYKCWICGIGSNRKDNLKRHEATCARNTFSELCNQ